MTLEGTSQRDEQEMKERFEKEGMEGLIRSLLESPDGHIRRYSAYLLGTLGNPDAIPYLVCALKDLDKGVREQAARALAGMGKDSVIPLVTLLRDHAWQTRYRAAEALGKIQDERSAEPLIHALGDERDHVRYMAAKALGQVRNDYAIPFLARLLKDENVFVRGSAANALGLIGGEMAREALIKALTEEPDESVRKAIEYALGVEIPRDKQSPA
jgi:HEAT repeat protein